MSDLARNVYQQAEVKSANSLELVVMLYDGAIRFLGEAKVCIQNKDLRGKTRTIDRALAILGELQSTLKLEEGGEIARSLDRLYTYLMGRTLEASQKLTVTQLDEAIKLLRILNSAWTEIAVRSRNPENMQSVRSPMETAVSAAPSPDGSFKVFG